MAFLGLAELVVPLVSIVFLYRPRPVEALPLPTGRPLGTACVLFLLSWGILVGAGTSPARAQEQPQARPQPDTSRSDTSRLAPTRPDVEKRPARPLSAPSDSDSLAIDRLAGAGAQRPRTPPDTGLVNRYLPSRSPRTGALFESRSPFLGPRAPSPSSSSIRLDSSGTHYTLDDAPHTDGPMRLDAEAYRRASFQSNRQQNWTDLVEQRQQQRTQRSGLGVSMQVPGGRESAFTTIFGKPQVDLRVNGKADINAGFKYSKNDRRASSAAGDATQLDPNFKQNLRLGITGTIGDKMKINVDWDTKSQFDYQNQVKLEYTGYEDEIIQKVEAGNVFLETPSQLISGGQSLFGIKSTFQLGNLSLTTIASQQEGQSNSLSIEGGAETTEFNLKPTDYDDDKHFFLGYYFRNNWNRAHTENPSTITLFNNFSEITNIEVWKLQTTQGNSGETETQKVVGLVDLGEPSALLREADGYTRDVLPDSARDQYTASDLTALRDGNTTVSTYVQSGANLQQPLQSQDFENGTFKKLEKGRDYRINDKLGFLSLTQRLRSNEALAVAFKYRAGGDVREIGDFSGEQGGSSGGVTADRLVLKLLRPSNPVAPGTDTEDTPSAWYLEMKNIYQLGGRGLNANSFSFDVEYSPPGQGAQTSLPQIAGQQSLLQMLGLDRLDQSGTPNPDNEFDFVEGLTVDSEQGLLYFRYLQPFGDRLFEVATENGNRSDASSFAFPELYRKKKSNAQKENQEKNVYEMTGSYKGQAKGFYDLKAFTGLVDGSVKVTSGGQTLKEGTDYVVDYQSGTVNITNQSYLSDGRKINIDYEQQSIANLQKKTLLGARADWALRDQFALGATVMRLSQKSPVDKYRIGEEPIQNTIWGVDGSMELEPRWLTQAVDALPLVQTRAESSVSLSGEFAQLRPGHTRTEAFEQTLQDVRSSDKDDYAPDERNGVSYIDDFEGFENTFSLREQLDAWQVSAAPDSIAPRPDLDGDVPGNADDRARSHWRGSFGWYRLNQQIKEDLEGKVASPNNSEATELLDVKEVFPNRDTRGSADPTLRTLDFYFNPWRRGPYNYTDDLVSFFQNPKRVWGGITRRLPEGYVDFSRQNVEFVEFIVKVYPENGEVTDGSKLFVNLGTISEDVIPNEQLNTENGLSFTFNESELGELSRLAFSKQAGTNTIEVRNNKTEDLGLDGLVSYTDRGPYAEGLLERNFYRDFVNQADSLLNAGGVGLTSPQRERLEAEIARIKNDPSGDDYQHYQNNRYFNNEDFFAETPTLQQRFSRYYGGYELNGFEPQDQLAEDVSLRRGLTGKADTEDLDKTGGNVNFSNDYYQYAIPLDSLGIRAETDAGPTDYVVSRAGKKGSNWYKVRIPVRAFTERVGNIQDFTSVESIRLWTQGHAAPVTMRLASLELVGSQWRTSAAIAEQPVERGDVMEVGDGELRVASINNEEDPGYKPPVGAVVSRSRTSRGAQQQNREQALLLNVNELAPGQQRGVFKTYQQGLDLLKYSNLRMYTHVHGASNSPQVKDRIRKNLRLFVRLGSNETSDYYEYEQPLTPSDMPGTQGAATPWLENNEMNLLLSALSQLKTARTQFGFPTDSTFTTDQVDLPVSEFAPEGTRLKIRGTPSLNQVNTVVIGVRHAGQPTSAAPLRNLELWTNELRVSGFDERKGWATNTSANVSLADLATLQGSFQRQTDGFGSLSSTLDERKQADNTSWSARAEVQLGSLFPKRQGWSIPVTMQVQSSLTEPRFDPQRGDVRIQEVQDQFDVLPDTTLRSQFASQYPDQSVDQIRETLKDSVKQASQTYSLQRTVTANLSKSGSDSWWMQNTLDATSLNFSYLDRTARSPQLVVDEKWSWSGSFDYQLDFGRARTVTPLGFLPDVPVLGALSDLQLNYVPTSLSFSGSADRGVSTKRDRPSPLRSSGPNANARPPLIAKPFRENQNFTHNRTFSLQYDPFGFLSFGFDTNVQQTLNDVAARTQRNLIFTEDSAIGSAQLTDVDTTAFFDNPQRFPINVPDSVTAADLRESLGETVFLQERLRAKSEGDVFRDLFFGSASPRTNSYQQRFSSTLSLGLTDRKALNWIDLQDISYQASFNWKNGAKGSLRGASVQNAVSIRTGVSLKPNKVWERFGFYERLKEAQRASEQDRRDDGAERDRPSGEEQDDSQRGEPGGNASDGEESAAEAGDAEADLSWADVPLPDPVGLLRGLALTFMDIRDFTINYNGERASRSSNIGTPVRDTTTGEIVGVNTRYSLLNAVQGDGPSIGYRLGLSRSIDPQTGRVFPEGQNVTDNLNNQHRFEARTALTPSSSLNIDLNWNVSWSTQPQIEFQKPFTGPGLPTPGDTTASIQRVRRETGNASASVWAFGNYKSFFKRQLDRLQSNVEASDRIWKEREVALTEPSVTAAFRETYLTGGTSIGGHGFVPLPLPGWTVRYSGLSDWPLIKRVTESVSLNHGYNATYETGFSSNSTAGDTSNVTVTGQQFSYVEAKFRPQSLPTIQEQFQPLIGVDITWPWDLQTSFQWNRSVTTGLREVDAVRERKENELSGSLSYSKRGLRLPFLPRIENRIRLSLNFTRSISNERTYNLTAALQQAQSNNFNYDPSQALQGDNVQPRKTSRLTMSPEISYTVSNRVTANFRLTYEKFDGNNTGQSSYTRVNGTFNLTVSISQN